MFSVVVGVWLQAVKIERVSASVKSVRNFFIGLG